MIRLLSNISGQKIFAPFFHVVSNGYLPHIKPLYFYFDEQTFKNGLDFLLSHFNPLSLEDLHKMTTTKTKPNKPVLFLSFDDGLKEMYTIVADILETKGIPATFFINSAFADNNELFFRFKAALLSEFTKDKNEIEVKNLQNKLHIKSEIKAFLLSIAYDERQKLDTIADLLGFDFKEFLTKEKPYMNRAQLSDLANKGFSIGAHSHDHPEFRYLPVEEQEKQIKQSVDFIKSIPNQNILSFSFPFTDHEVPIQTLKYLHKHVDVSFGTAGLKNDSFQNHIQRIPFETGKSFKYESYKAYLYSTARSILNKNIIFR